MQGFRAEIGARRKPVQRLLNGVTLALGYVVTLDWIVQVLFTWYRT